MCIAFDRRQCLNWDEHPRRTVPIPFRQPEGDVLVRLKYSTGIHHLYTTSKVVSRSPVLKADLDQARETCVTGTSTLRVMDLDECLCTTVCLITLLDLEAHWSLESFQGLNDSMNLDPEGDFLLIRLLAYHQLLETPLNPLRRRICGLFYVIFKAKEQACASDFMAEIRKYSNEFWLGATIRASAASYRTNVTAIPPCDSMSALEYWNVMSYLQRYDSFVEECCGEYDQYCVQLRFGELALSKLPDTLEEIREELPLALCQSWCGNGTPNIDGTNLPALFKKARKELKKLGAKPCSVRSVKEQLEVLRQTFAEQPKFSSEPDLSDMWEDR